MSFSTTTSPIFSNAANAAIAGLMQHPRKFPGTYAYDAEGIRLFEAMKALPCYPIARTETALLAASAAAIAEHVPPGRVVVEYGATRADKALPLLRRFDASAYVPIDLAAEPLAELPAAMATEPFPVLPIAADFMQPLTLPAAVQGRPVFGLLLGTTIGNIDPVGFLLNARATLGKDAFLLVGADLPKDPTVLLTTYSDPSGIEAAFHLNALRRLNREAGADFDITGFRHEVRWNAADSQIEIGLVSLRQQRVHIGDVVLDLAPGERIETLQSRKYSVAELQRIARMAGWCPVEFWANPTPSHAYALHLLAT